MILESSTVTQVQQTKYQYNRLLQFESSRFLKLGVDRGWSWILERGDRQFGKHSQEKLCHSVLQEVFYSVFLIQREACGPFPKSTMGGSWNLRGGEAYNQTFWKEDLQKVSEKLAKLEANACKTCTWQNTKSYHVKSLHTYNIHSYII